MREEENEVGERRVWKGDREGGKKIGWDKEGMKERREGKKRERRDREAGGESDNRVEASYR